MFAIKLPKAVRKAAQKTGIKLASTLTGDARGNLKSLSKQLKVSRSVPAFVVPSAGVSGTLALSAANKVIRQANAKKAISNTRALAALGDPDAERGLTVIMAAEQAKRTGKSIPPPPSAVLPATFKRVYDKAEVYRLAQQSALRNDKGGPIAAKVSATVPTHTKNMHEPKVVKPGIWTRFKHWLGRKL